MLEWLVIILALAPLIGTLVYLDRKHAPAWSIWAVWMGYFALWGGVAGAFLYRFQIGPIVVFALLGAICGAAGALAMEWPFHPRQPPRR